MMHDYQNYTDLDLVALLNRGDERAFTEIYNRYWDKLFTTAVNRLGDIQEAREIVQDIFFKLWKRRTKVEIAQTLSIYLASAVKYEVLNLLAVKNRHRVYLQHIKHIQSDISEATLQQLSFSELRRELESVVNDLPEKCRLVYKLSREAGYTNNEIARTMHISEKTVEAHLSKALRRLRNSLGFFIHFL
ncbi:MAG: RNA polymerase sigma-70 factor [Chitinophagaceae bacterium]|nr:RNA polymerase sigma-70 factor [Chitinophagaceae bacterium]